MNQFANFKDFSTPAGRRDVSQDFTSFPSFDFKSFGNEVFNQQKDSNSNSQFEKFQQTKNIDCKFFLFLFLFGTIYMLSTKQ
jgi:hypothetical protein